ncbi:flavin reductase family protein [Agromyces intestinalis]|uniref:Flavin reductase family protein n=1 Tax=Agromyces intestinalis TaxID=2592652 RepID=A0A5C1YH39_9MICO|nr:flavin reductase family protein [Agromyces intestinalis]QEO14928.1 flavin reductase family protein [Agromyces intestinalis]
MSVVEDRQVAVPATSGSTSSEPDNPLRRALGHMATSVTLVTTTHDGGHHGFTANSFAAVSSDPPLVTVFLANSATCYGAFAETEHVAVNVLADGQGELARRFATKGADKFAGIDLDPRHPHLPVVAGAMASLIGRIDQRWPAGDHLMLLIAVDDVVFDRKEPLVYHNRTFRRLL